VTLGKRCKRRIFKSGDVSTLPSCTNVACGYPNNGTLFFLMSSRPTRPLSWLNSYHNYQRLNISRISSRKLVEKTYVRHATLWERSWNSCAKTTSLWCNVANIVSCKSCTNGMVIRIIVIYFGELGVGRRARAQEHEHCRDASSPLVDRGVHTPRFISLLSTVRSVSTSVTDSDLKKVKAYHTHYRALGPELIPVYRQSARRWL